MKRLLRLLAFLLAFLFLGCNTCHHRAKADREAYSTIREKSRLVEGMPKTFTVDREHYEGEGNERVMAPTPLGRMGREIVLEKS